MVAWRFSGAVAVLFFITTLGHAQPYTLAETSKAGDCFRYQLNLKLTGQLKVVKEGKTVPLTLKADAAHVFPERVMVVSEAGFPEKVARVYETAKAVIGVDNGKTERTLRPGRSLVVAQRHKDQPLVYCPAGAFYRPELELVSEHFDTLCLTGVLPTKPVKVGDSWKLPNPVAQALCNFEGMTENKLTGKLEKVVGDVATFSVTGAAAGVEAGAMVKLKISATGTVALKARRLLSLEWKQNDDRDRRTV